MIHAGLYYAPGSLKAQLCREGRDLLIAYAEERGIPYRLPGKLVVALDEGEIPRLDELANRGRATVSSGLRVLGPDEMREIEPHVAGIRAIHVPETGIIDYILVAEAFADDVRSRRRPRCFSGAPSRLSTPAPASAWCSSTRECDCRPEGGGLHRRALGPDGTADRRRRGSLPNRTLPR